MDVNENSDKRERFSNACRRPRTVKDTGIIREGERMCITTAGLLFCGETAYPSNMYKAPIVFEDKDYYY